MSVDTDVRDFRLPDLGEGLEEGEIVAWHVTVGDVVQLNQPIADIETAKAVVSVPSPFSGKVIARVGEVGDVLAVGSLLLRIRIGDNDGDDVVGDTDGATRASDPTSSGDAGDTGDTGDATTVADAGESRDAAASGAGNGAVTGGSAAAMSTSDGDGPGTATPGAQATQPRSLVGYGSEDADSGPAPSPNAGDAGRTSRPKAKPPVRKLAKELGVELTAVTPTGPGETITRDDVRTAAGDGERVTAQVDADGAQAEIGFRGRRPGEIEPIKSIRRTIVDKMEQSRREIPSASCSREVDLTRLWQLRHDLTDQARSEGHDVRITPFVVLMRAVVVGLRRFPTLNAQLVGRDRDGGEPGEIHLLEHINLGVAVDTDRGLVVPSIKDAHTKSLLGLAVEATALAERARRGVLTPAELTGGTFTVNNYGVFGNDDAEPIINHPEAGILGIGAIRSRPWVVDGEILPRHVATLRLVFDHRVCDGGEAGRFVTYVADLCEEPTRVLLHA